MKTPKRPWRSVLRRALALALALTAAWVLSLTVDLSLPDLSDSALAVSLLSSQLPSPTEPDGQALAGWPRLLLSQSSLLAAAEGAVFQSQAEPEPDPAPSQSEPTPQEPEPAELDQDGDGDDSAGEPVPDLTPPRQEDGILETTALGGTTGRYMYSEGVYIYNRTNLTLDASVATAGKVDVPLGDGPQILIYHTHGSEAYSQSDGDLYQESDPYRTTDCAHNVVRVGEEIANVFRAHGFQVIHDTTLFDYPAYNGAYDRSKAAVEQWLSQYPTIKITLDVHRDALVGANGEIYKLVSQQAGEKVAQVMLVLGTNDAGLDHPRWKDNLAFAVKLQQELSRGYGDLVRPIVLRSGRYNQQLSPGALLVEVGGHGNTLSECLAAARLWADNVARTLLTLKTG